MRSLKINECILIWLHLRASLGKSGSLLEFTPFMDARFRGHDIKRGRDDILSIVIPAQAGIHFLKSILHLAQPQKHRRALGILKTLIPA